jgi:uncharacterized protein
MIAAADDPYIKAVILMLPFASGRADAAGFYPPGVLERAWKEREGRARSGTGSAKLEKIPAWDSSEEQANGERGDVVLHGPALYGFIAKGNKWVKEAGIPFSGNVTLRSVYLCARVEPMDYISKIAPKAVLYFADPEGRVGAPFEVAKKAFEMAGEPKELVLTHDLTPDERVDGWMERQMDLQVNFLKKHMK